MPGICKIVWLIVHQIQLPFFTNFVIFTCNHTTPDINLSDITKNGYDESKYSLTFDDIQFGLNI